MTEQLRDILTKFNIIPEYDIESFLWEKITNGSIPCNRENMERVIRFSVINKQLKSQGLDPLLFVVSAPTIKIEVKESKSELETLRDELRCEILKISLNEEDMCVGQKYGLKDCEYACIYGDSGTFLDLKLENSCYSMVISRVKNRIVQMKFDTDKELMKYCIRKIVLLAQRRWRCPEQIPKLKNINAETIRSIKILKSVSDDESTRGALQRKGA